MRHTPDAVMIFAAGFGTRMKELTRDVPKPMIPVAGKPLIDHALDLTDAAGLKHRVANVHYKPEALIRHLNAREVIVSDERDAILETGGGLKHARPLLPKAPLFTMNSDAVFQGPNPFKVLQHAWDPNQMGALLLMIPPAQAHGTDSKGDFSINATGALSRGAGFIYSGIQIIHPQSLNGIEDEAFSLNVVWNELQSQGRLYGVRYGGQWCDVGHPEGITMAENLLKSANV